MHALGAGHFASVALPRRWTTPSRAGAEQLQRRAQELLARQPDAQLPPELQRIADILGITLPPAANLWRVFVPAFASSGGEGLLVCARRWLEVVPRDSSARTTRCQHLLDVVLPTVHSRLDERLALEARANSERLSLDALQRYDPAADRATHEPVTQHFVEGVILGGRPQLSSAETAKAFRAADTSYAALCSGRCPLWHSAVGAIVMLVMYSYTRSWAAMAVVAALQYGAPSVSWLRDLVAKGRVPSAQAEADMLRVYILQAIVFINDNVGHYKKMVSYSAGLSATVLVHCARLVAVVHGYTNGVQHMPHLVPALWPEAAVACPAEYTAAEEKARMIAQMEAELHAALETVITEDLHTPTQVEVRAPPEHGPSVHTRRGNRLCARTDQSLSMLRGGHEELVRGGLRLICFEHRIFVAVRNLLPHHKIAIVRDAVVVHAVALHRWL